jgi:hypothetical protein
VERLYVHYLRELVIGCVLVASRRAIAHDLGLARVAIQKYAPLAAAAGYLGPSQPPPDAAELTGRPGPPPQPPRTPSTVEPYRAQVEQLVFDQTISTWLACHRHAFDSFIAGEVKRRVDPTPRGRSPISSRPSVRTCR